MASALNADGWPPVLARKIPAMRSGTVLEEAVLPRLLEVSKKLMIRGWNASTLHVQIMYNSSGSQANVSLVRKKK